MSEKRCNLSSHSKTHSKQPSQQHNTQETQTYIGLCSTTFKLRYSNHKQSIKNINNRTQTMLSQYTWDLKDNNLEFNETWKLLATAKSYNPGTKTCNLCSKEKYYIIYKPEMSTLNKRTEFTSQCRHRSPYLLKNVK